MSPPSGLRRGSGKHRLPASAAKNVRRQGVRPRLELILRAKRPTMTSSGIEDGAEQYLESAPMIRMASYFHSLATGETQVPKQSVASRIRHLLRDPDVLAYHDLMVAEAGPLFTHFLASVPAILEEMSRVGVALTRYSERRRQHADQHFEFYEVDAFDGTNGRTLAKRSNGLIRTFTNSPNPANETAFNQFANHEFSTFHPQAFAHVTPRLFREHARLDRFSGTFDYIYETAAFQFYGVDRADQIRHVARLLKPNGLIFFLEKLNCDSLDEYDKRESVKDELHKRHYFSREEIDWKRNQMLSQMQNGQVTFDTLVASIHERFEHVYLLWNGTNFHEFVASNDARSIEEFVSLLGEPCIEPVFCFDHPVPRRVAGPRGDAT
ncbi:class I SAM-dependent methyltransferase [Burkholderia sp. AU30280]|uniref:class I SAM-dependent methyltransferase n=1 Tax=Burkholderia sp. AU30280 TaxID=2879628 RepID=UPI001CF0FC14|nr:class I SAM-dependent methyltransferase [Burkholderia sp. AU30280]MCA8276373.1 class I SAM-dependent methyltransferase [Burkholderia sp. AU30280]